MGTQSDELTQGKHALLSSDEEESNTDANPKHKSKNKRKMVFVYSGNLHF